MIYSYLLINIYFIQYYNGSGTEVDLVFTVTIMKAMYKRTFSNDVRVVVFENIL